MTPPRNLFREIPAELPEELSEELVAQGAVRVERIVSRGHVTAAGTWYDQDENEWILLLAGHARLRFEEDDRSVPLEPGDSLEIRAHVRHRVEWTDPARDTVWLAVFYP